jgi:hypothetical protein
MATTTAPATPATPNAVEPVRAGKQPSAKEEREAPAAASPLSPGREVDALNYIEDARARTHKAESIRDGSAEPRADAAAPRVTKTRSTAELGADDIAALLREERKQQLQRQLETRYVQQNNEYRFRADPNKVAFRDEGKRLTTVLDNPSVARSIVDAAEAKGWSSVRINGTDAFRRVVWVEAATRGIKTLGYEPTRQDQETVAAERARLANRALSGPARVAPSSEPAPASDQARARPSSGTLLEHGPARYRFDPQESPSYYVKLADRGKERVLWGVELGQALRESGARPGDRVSLTVTAAKPVSVDRNVRDDAGQVVGTERSGALRNEWNVAIVGRTAVAKTLDAVVAHATQLSRADRERVVAAGVRKQAELEAAGAPKAVRIYDATAERTVGRFVPQPERPKERAARAR